MRKPNGYGSIKNSLETGGGHLYLSSVVTESKSLSNTLLLRLKQKFFKLIIINFISIAPFQVVR